MKLNKLKEMAGNILNKSKHKLTVDTDTYMAKKEMVDKAITRADVRAIIAENIIKKKGNTGQSRGRARVLQKKKKLKRRRGPGKRKGTEKARKKVNEHNLRVRGLRKKLRTLKKENKLKDKKYSKLYLMIKGNYFRGKKHLEAYVNGDKK